MKTYSKRTFSSLYQYSSPANPRVWLGLSKNGESIGKVHFELFANHAPKTAAAFQNMCSGSEGSLEGHTFSSGHNGIYMKAEAAVPCGGRGQDENLSLRHERRGMLTLANNGEDSNNTDFLVTLGKADVFDGYNVAFGEIVEGQDVLERAEQSLSRLGHFNDEIKIDSCGTH
jgi:cyclophilin family peptidyl-prolyl cis-trans isomerase